MSLFLRTFTLLASILFFSLIIEVAIAKQTDTQPQLEPKLKDKGPFATEDDGPFILDPTPFYVQKPFLCQRGDAFIAILESRKEYRAFIGKGQLVKEDASSMEVWVFTAVNFQTGTFTIFEWHTKQNVACILAIGQGFQILETEPKAQTTIHVKDILTIDN